jgi:tetratricopeptide (TPR) repeat protein
MSNNKGFRSILVPAATVFFSSACIMILELVASRLIARHLGSSLYTWTSVIGIVLAGITIGNYIGGRIADRFHATKALAVLLGISSATCVATVVLNNLIGDWIWLWKLSWPAHVLTHVFLVFMLPSTLLGTISPVVAKMALDRGLPTGRTVGDIYAFGAAGSIAGTFLAGFYLIAAMGTIAIIWTIGAVLLLMAILFWPKLWILYIWAAVYIAFMTMGMAPIKWSANTVPPSLTLSVAWALGLRERPNPAIIYEDESQYSHIAVKRTSTTADKRSFMLDKLTHSKIDMDDILDLQYSYEQIYAAVTHLLTQDKNKLSVFAIGGGGYVFPRYIEKVWPGSRIDVAEIDPQVTEAAILAFGLDRNTTINTYTMDARNYVDTLLMEKRNGRQIPQYDVVYEDAISDYSVPYQLTTREFNDKIVQILTDDGVYMINLIDTYYVGSFVGAVIGTLQKTFPYVYVITEEHTHWAPWSTFVVVAAMREINFENLASQKSVARLNLWILSNSEVETLREKSRGVVLTDDYAPVENLLAPVVRQSALSILPSKYLERAQKLESEGRLDESLAMYKEVVKRNPIDPVISISAYSNIGQILASQGKWQQAIDAANDAIKFNETAPRKYGMADMYFNMSMASKKLGRDEDASEYMNRAIETYKADLALRPASTMTLRNLSWALMEAGRFSEAVDSAKSAIDTDSFDIRNHIMLADVLSKCQRYDEAIEVLKKAIVFFSNVRNDEAIGAIGILQKHIWSIEDTKKVDKK